MIIYIIVQQKQHILRILWIFVINLLFHNFSSTVSIRPLLCISDRKVLKF